MYGIDRSAVDAHFEVPRGFPGQVLTGDPRCKSVAAIGDIRRAAASSATARSLLVGSTALVTGLAGVLRPLTDRSCYQLSYQLPSAETMAAAEVAEAVVWLFGWLLPVPQNAAVLHVRGDAALLLRMSRQGATRGLRHAAALQP